MALVVVLASLMVVALAELIWQRRRREFPALRRQVGNVGVWVLNLLLGAFLFISPGAVRAQFETLGLALPSWPIANAALSDAVGFLLLDLLRYAVHRCQHAIPFLWRLHALHHSDPDVDVTTSLRHHPIEAVIAGAIYWAAVLVLDIPAAIAATHAAAVFAAAAVTHGNMRLPERIERWLQPVVITLDLHLIHHSILHQQAGSNFGAVLSIWDRMFGTFRWLPRPELDRLVFGVRELAPANALKPSVMIMTPWLLRNAKLEGVTSSPASEPA